MSTGSQTLSRDRVFCGAIALLVVVLLICGIGTIGLISDVRELNPSYPDSAILAEEDTAGDEAVDKESGSKVLAALEGVSLQAMFEDAFLARAPIEGQVVFLLRNGGIQRAVRPTGPPSAYAQLSVFSTL